MNIENSNELKVNDLNENIQSSSLKKSDANISINKNDLKDSAKNTNMIKINPLNTHELIKGIISKHKRLLDEYEVEFSVLDEKVQSINIDINSANKNKEETINRMEVLKEKPLQFYHQILNLLGDLSEFKEIDNKLLHSINDKIVKLTKPKQLLKMDETKQCIEEIKSLISELTVKAQGSEIIISTILARLESALEASGELASIRGNDEKFNNDSKKFTAELKGITSRHGWLKNRIDSHKKASKHWNLKLTELETMSNGEHT
jgi:succinate dehydrogenase/fumarate reductase-like Fe-S protein